MGAHWPPMAPTAPLLMRALYQDSPGRRAARPAVLRFAPGSADRACEMQSTPCQKRGEPPRRDGMNHALAPGMKDLLYVAITVGFFAISWLYVKAADRL